MKYIHDKGIIHRDLKTANIFISLCGDLVIGDFGLAIEMNKEDKELKGTTIYTAPELWNKKTRNYTKASDMYAFGCILYEIYTLHYAFDPNLDKKQIVNMITTTKEIHFDMKEESRIPEIEDLIHRMMEIDPTKRIDSEKINNNIKYFIENGIETKRIIEIDGSSNITTAYLNPVVLLLVYYYYYRLIFIQLVIMIKQVDVIMESNLEKYVK